MRIEFAAPDEALRFCIELQIQVPPLNGPERRTHLQRQVWCLQKYMLLHCGSSGDPVWPTAIHVEFGNRAPDFVLTWPSGKATGLEVTEITTRRAQKNLSSQRMVGSLAGGRHGIGGDEAEKQLGKRFRKSMRAKLNKLADGKWMKADEYEILGYENGPFPMVDRPAAVKYLDIHTKSLVLPTVRGYPDFILSLLFSSGDCLARKVNGVFQLVEQ